MKLSAAVLAVVVILQWMAPGPVLVSAQGSWQLLLKSAGIASMHTAITRYDTAIMLDRTDVGASRIALPSGVCRNNPRDLSLKHDCTAHSVMFNPGSNTVRPLFVYTDTWCSSGQFAPDGTLVQTGGDFDGNKKIRRLTPCAAGGNCNWVETNVALSSGRWYASNQLLPDGRQIVVGGRAAPTYEFVPKRRAGEGIFALGVLNKCCDNLYPFVHLLPDGTLFIFANRDSVALNWQTGRVVRNYPTIPGNPRNYPSAGSSVMLPLIWQANFARAEVLVCGGAATGASKSNNIRAPCSVSCGRIVATAAKAGWAMENMPIRRCMGDMVIQPGGDVLVINGAQNGFQGWGKANNAAQNPVNYATNARAGKRFQVYTGTGIPRVYHSTANLLGDGRILLAGSNTHQFYTFRGAFPTELRVEAFSPPYLGANFNGIKPRITGVPRAVRYGQTFAVTFALGKRKGGFEANINSSPFVTHSYAMGQRQVKLKTSAPVVLKKGGWSVQVTAPPNGNIAPPQYYMLFLLQAGIPSRAAWLQVI